MLYKLGRVLQLVGLIMLPCAIAGNMGDPPPLKLQDSLLFSAIGIIVFIVGWMLQQAGKPPSA
jgi:hypothetical protein